MKIQSERSYPVMKDVAVQLSENPKLDYCFMYDDSGAIYRAILCDQVTVGERTVSALRGGMVVCQLPADSTWRLVHRSNMEFLTGAEMEELELRGLKAKKDLTEKLIEELKLDEPKVETEYAKTGYNPKLYH